VADPAAAPEPGPDPQKVADEAAAKAKDEYDAKLAENAKAAAFGVDMHQRLTILRNTDKQAYARVKAILEGREAPAPAAPPATPPAKAGDSTDYNADPYNDGPDVQAIAEAAAAKAVEAMSAKVDSIDRKLMSHGLTSDIERLQAKYGSEVVAANYDDLMGRIDNDPTIIDRPGALESAFKDVDYKRAIEREVKKAVADKDQQDDLNNRRRLPAGPMGGRDIDMDLDKMSFEDMWEQATEHVRSNPSAGQE